jgi:8-oxo-dGTP pyrophosphatase MutT (NUDIX family)
MSQEIVQAAGGAVWRPGRGGTVEIALVHRPRYDDWSLPKGKLLPGENHADGALREVEEETGMRCRLGRYLGDSSYSDRKGRHKVVRYWEMVPLDGAFRPNAEVDVLRWLAPGQALDLLSYDHDRHILERLSTVGPSESDLLDRHEAP